MHKESSVGGTSFRLCMILGTRTVDYGLEAVLRRNISEATIRLDTRVPNWFTKAADGARWVQRSSVSIALGWGLFGLAFIATTRRFDLLPRQTAEVIGFGPVVLLLILMMGSVVVHGVSTNIRSIARAIGWLRNRFDR